MKYFLTLSLLLSFFSSHLLAKTQGCNKSPMPLFANSADNLELSHIPVQTILRIASPRKNVENNPYFPYYAHGSGVLVKYKKQTGFILSAFHVTYGREIVLVMLNDRYDAKRLFWAKLVKDDKNVDLSLYQIIDSPKLNISADIYQGKDNNYGQDIFVTGYPVTPKALFKAELFPNSRMIVRHEKLLGEKEFNGFELTVKPFIVSDCIDNGLSGGPAFDNQGHVLGINHSTDRFSDNPDGSFNGYLIPATIIREFLNKADLSPP